MQRTKLIVVFLSAAAFAVGCKPTEQTSTVDDRKATEAQFDKVKKETKEATKEIKDFAYAQKSEFVENMRNQLAVINKDLDQLSEKIERSSDAAKAEAKPKLQALRDQAATLNKQLDKAKSATESTWDDVKAGSRKAYDELTESFQQARHWVADKIAP